LRRARAILLTSLLAAGAPACTWSDARRPEVVGIQPAAAPNHLDVPLRIEGADFAPAVRADFDDPDRSTIDAVFSATLLSAAGPIPLSGVRLLTSSALEATLPAGAPAGTYDVQVRDPRGRIAVLAAAFTLFVQNKAPLARLVVTPGGGTAGITVFTLDASTSSDTEDPLTALQFRFDSDGNGGFSAWSATPTHAQVYASPGTFTAAVEIRDSGGLVGFATAVVVVSAPDELVAVTTSADERDAGATPTAPGGAGLSLREAIAWVNLQPTPKTITLGAPLTIVMTGSQRDLTLTAPGAAVLADPGVLLDFAGFKQACFKLDGPGQRLVGVTITGCDATFVSMTGRSAGAQVAQVTVAGSGRTAIGIDAQATSTSWIGPGNDLSGLSTAVNLLGDGYEVLGNRVHGCLVGAKLYGRPARILQNAFYGQVGSPPNQGVGLRAYSGDGPEEILHNVFDRNSAHGLQADAVTGLTVRNNLFTGNGVFGLSAVAAGLAQDHNGYFGNGAAAVSTGLATGATDVLLDPLYVDPQGGDFRLLPLSPAVDAGFDTGIDVNGPATGRFDGLAPDLGAAEAQ